MNWINKLERKFGKYYIPNLMLIITMISSGVYICGMVFGSSFYNYFLLDPSKIMNGEVWRLITYIFITPSNSILYVFTIYLFYLAGSSLEREWGEFKFNIYYLFGIVCTIVVGFINYFLLINGSGTSISNYVSNIVLASTVMNLSLFLAFAKIYPDFELLLFFIIPVKIKYLGYINWGVIILKLIRDLIINRDIGGALFTIVPIINYLLFFGGNNYRNAKMRRNSVIRMKDYKKKLNSTKKTYIHKCEVCGITNEDDPDMLFRYCSKCVGKHCYCEKHILNHEHKNK
ncbi:MAG: hypothetical protein GX275_11530 [Clostridiales bacterium]|nr:hypothetical protein [Clostridiales bacterium]